MGSSLVLLLPRKVQTQPGELNSELLAVGLRVNGRWSFKGILVTKRAFNLDCDSNIHPTTEFNGWMDEWMDHTQCGLGESISNYLSRL